MDVERGGHERAKFDAEKREQENVSLEEEEESESESDVDVEDGKVETRCEKKTTQYVSAKRQIWYKKPRIMVLYNVKTPRQNGTTRPNSAPTSQRNNLGPEIHNTGYYRHVQRVLLSIPLFLSTLTVWGVYHRYLGGVGHVSGRKKYREYDLTWSVWLLIFLGLILKRQKG
ncbi:hypothetical protein B0H13DRAFT_1924981 [Mycena leptocephala]|nr:hypothetical protein B0H13DRAFT_1924981 [Mycena leptocephala]